MISFRNPIYEKDRWSSGRNRGFLLALLVINGIISVIAIVVFFNVVSYIKVSNTKDYTALLQLYLTLAMAECMIVVMITPFIAGSGISQERERGNLELFFAAGLPPRKVVSGKLLSCMNMMMVLLITSLPVFSLVFVYGGIQMRDLAAMIGILLVVALEAAALSILCSARARRPAHGVLLAYGANVLLLGGSVLIHWAPKLLHQVSYGEQLGSPIAWYHYLLLANPVITFYGVLNLQAGSRSAIFDLINYQGNYRQNWVTQNWLPVSLCVQAAMVLLELLWAVRSLNSTGKGKAIGR